MDQASYSVTARDSQKILMKLGDISEAWLDLDVIKKDNLKVLDVGSGQGVLVMEMRRRGIEADGVDFNSPYDGSPGVSQWFRREDIRTRTTLPENHYDLVYSTFSLFSYDHVSAHERILALKEMARLTKTGGLVRIAPFSDVEKMRKYLNDVPELELLRVWKDKYGQVTAFDLRRTPRE